MERIILAFSKDETAEKIRLMLDGSGYEICMICHSGAELLRCVDAYDDVLVIMGYKLPDAVADDVYEELGERRKLMAIVKADRQSEIYNQDIFVVTLPINRQILINAIDTFIGDIERGRHKPKRSPEEEKIIQSAKAYLMENHMMSEEAAHRFIQKRSMDTGAKFIDTARMILGI